MSRTRVLVLAAAVLCAAGLGRAADAQAAELFYGVDAGQPPGHVQRPDTDVDRAQGVHRLARREQIVGLDVRPANKQLVALGSTSRLYRIDAATGAATVIGTAAFAPPLAGTTFGFDFNPDGRPDPGHLGCPPEPASAS